MGSESDDRNDLKDLFKTDCELASSHSEEPGGGLGGVEWSGWGGGKKKRQRQEMRREMMPLRLTESQFGCSILHYH